MNNNAGETIIDGENTILEASTITNEENAKLTINSGELICSASSTTRHFIENYGELIVNDGDISKIKQNCSTQGMIGNKNILIINDGNIDLIDNLSRATVLGGNVNSIVNRGELTLGELDDNIDTATPTVKGITNYNIFNFYDGRTIAYVNSEGRDTCSVTGMINNIPDNTSVVYTERKTDENNNEYRECIIKNISKVVSINGVPYRTIQEAINACTTSEKTIIKVEVDQLVLIAGESFKIDEGKNIVLDLNGKTILLNCKTEYLNSHYVFEVEGTFEITDSVGSGTVMDYMGSAYSGLIRNGGQTTISGGRYSLNKFISVWSKTKNVEKTKKTIIEKGIIIICPKVSDGAMCVYMEGPSGNAGDPYYEYGAVVDSDGITRFVQGPAELEIRGDTYIQGNIEASNAKIHGSGVIINGVVTAQAQISDVRYIHHLYMCSYSTIKNSVIYLVETNHKIDITDNSIIGGINTQSLLQDVTIKDSTVVGVKYRKNWNLGTVYASDTGAILQQNYRLQYSGRVVLLDGTIVNPEDGYYTFKYDIYNVYGEKTEYTEDSKQCKYGISGGKVVIGEKDFNMKKDTIKIYGKQFGIGEYYSGLDSIRTATRIYMYDGTVYGNRKAIENTNTEIVETETYYQDTYANDDKELYLEIVGTVTNRAQIENSGKYSTIKDALNAIENSGRTGTISLINEHTIISSESDIIVIKSGMNVTIDLNGYGIVGMIENAPAIKVESGATLTIIGDSDVGVVNKLGVAIENKGTLTIGNKDDGTQSNTTPIIEGHTNAIKNLGTLNFYDGVLRAVDDVVDGNDISGKTSGYTVTDSTEEIDGVTFNTKKLTN